MLPLIHDTQPCEVELEPGVHLWCSCGLSAHQPFCDFSHKGTGLVPKKIVVTDRPTTFLLCNCKHTACAPLCDETHCRLGKTG